MVRGSSPCLRQRRIPRIRPWRCPGRCQSLKQPPCPPSAPRSLSIACSGGTEHGARQPGGTGPLLVGVDAGTTNTKAMVVDAAGSVIAVASEPTPIAYPRPEWAEYDGESLWRSSARAIRGGARPGGPARDASSASRSRAWPRRRCRSMPPAGRPGRRSPGSTSVRGRRSPRSRGGSARTACSPSRAWRRTRSSACASCSGIAATAPKPSRARSEWLNVADYLAWRLCGEMATDYSLACRTFALDISDARLVGRGAGGDAGRRRR